MECICQGRVYRTDWTAPPTWDGLRYRIWLRETPFGWFQRHEWQRPEQNTTLIEDWIPSGRKRQIPAHYKEVTSEMEML